MDFFEHHGVTTLICLAICPRLTLLIASFSTGGLLWWLGWLLTPHLLVAILSLPYLVTNPILVIMAWLVACEGTSAEHEAVDSTSHLTP